MVRTLMKRARSRGKSRCAWQSPRTGLLATFLVQACAGSFKATAGPYGIGHVAH